MTERNQWGSRMGFILSAIGSAVGLGNIWRFPYTVASNGGGAFLIPYFVALLTAGIPILILEFALGQKFRTSASGVFAKINKKWEALGWWQTAIGFAISTYYTVIIAWAIGYMFNSMSVSWGNEAKDFFFNKYLNISASPLEFGSVQFHILIPLLLVWIINYGVLAFGVKTGLEKANKVVMPLMIFSIIVIAVRGITLPGALDGLDYFFKPDFSQLLNGKVWVAAYGQIFYSLSICFGIMLAYSSYLPKDSDIVNNAFITAFGNCSFSILSGIAVFSILGYMAAQSNVPVQEVATAGVGLAFVVFPQAISALPSFNGLFGVFFFGCLVFAGFSSSMSIIESVVAAICDKFNTSRIKALSIVCGVGALLSVLFATQAGLYVLDIVDHFINNYGIAVAGLIETILLAWFFNLESVRQYVNPISDYTVGRWWNVCIKYITPVILGVMTILNVIGDIKVPYEGYGVEALLLMGVLVIVVTLILGFVFARIDGHKDYKISLDEGGNSFE